jgi:hypothetical protein
MLSQRYQTGEAQLASAPPVPAPEEHHKIIDVPAGALFATGVAHAEYCWLFDTPLQVITWA